MIYKTFDDVFDLDFRINFYNSASQCAYVLGWSDRDDSVSKRYKNLHSPLTPQNLSDCGFFENIKNQELKKFLQNKKDSHHVINMSHPTNVFFPHTHSGYWSLVYYINVEWQQHWHGETIIYKENGIDIESCVSFVPNRILLINKSVPHALRPPSVACPDYRYTFACFLEDIK